MTPQDDCPHETEDSGHTSKKQADMVIQLTTPGSSDIKRQQRLLTARRAISRAELSLQHIEATTATGKTNALGILASDWFLIMPIPAVALDIHFHPLVGLHL